LSSLPKPRIRIENVVASVSVNQRIDLDKVARSLLNVEYDPEQFPGLVYRLKKPKTATLIFNSGKMVCTGAKSEAEATRAVHRIVEHLREAGIQITGEPIITVQNIVASASLGAELNLELAAYSLENVMYEPEQFPGLIYRMKEPKVVILLFGSGKLVCTGAKKEEDVYSAVNNVMKTLLDLGIMKLKGPPAPVEEEPPKITEETIEKKELGTEKPAADKELAYKIEEEPSGKSEHTNAEKDTDLGTDSDIDEINP
jgi:transcription initiation factor TFIID TATA-box-binding protein